MDPLLSDEAAATQAGANYVTARKEATAKFPSSAESDEIKSALAEYDNEATRRRSLWRSKPSSRVVRCTHANCARCSRQTNRHI